MKLFVLNPSRQKLMFSFRILNQGGVRYVDIGPGQQELVFDGQPDAVHYIIAQNERYGLIEDKDVRAKRKGHTGMIFAVDRFVDISSAEIAEKQNHESLIARGAEVRKLSAIAAAEVVGAKIRDAGFSESHLQDTSLSLRGEDEKGQTAVLNEESTVSRQGEQRRGRR